jgi:KUP system potassium uptake protein
MSQPTAPSKPTASRPLHGLPSLHDDDGSKSHQFKLALAALGVVYGDIGTSPLYAVRECFHGSHGINVERANVLGVLSLIFWSLILIISIKYVFYILRADNKGEGGILALTALASATKKVPGAYPALIAIGVLGAALLIGEGIITPAISVLSAVEGLEIAAPSLKPFVIPVTIAILVGLFSFQRKGTASVGLIFGPITALWFTSLGVLGAVHLVRKPEVLEALSPVYGAQFLAENGYQGIMVLGSVFLVVTGGEALYADLGHFGKRPIRQAWFFLCFPALLLNYLGQGVMLLESPDAKESPFFRMVPEWGLYPMIALSTAATVIASQALISGVYSLSRQAIMLGLLPRLSVRHTSADERGQIYVPIANWFLMIGCISLVLGFGSSANLAAAYGIAATLTMMTTTILAFFLTRYGWGWSLPKSLAVTLVFLIPEGAFVAANIAKITHGGWFPLTMGAIIFATMLTWKRGREILAQRFREQLLPLVDFFELTRVELPAHVPGTAVFMSSTQAGTPPALLQNFMHNRVLHKKVILLTIQTSDAARVSEEHRFEVEQLEHGFARIIGRYGFMEQPDAPKLLQDAGLIPGVEHVTFFLGRENLLATARPGMAKWRVHWFAFLSRNAQPATKFFAIPPDRVVEMGAQIEL